MSKFKFFCGADLINKAQDQEGNDVMRIGGIASTMDKDSDGEFLDPNGFEVEEFLELGLVNWHHGTKDKPSTIIGEPVVAEIRPEGFYVECDLYKSSTMACEVYELANVMSKDSKKRKLGFSIEGSVLERKSDDKKSADYNIIKKALITGLAITHMPKNAKTFADIIKGKGIEEEDEEIEKDLSTESGAALKKESVDKNLKIVTNISKSKYVFIKCDEEVMYDKIFKAFGDIEIEKSEKIYNLLTNIQKGMESNSENITDEKIEKAFGVLGLGMDGNPFIEKAKETKTELTPEEVAAKMESKTYGEEGKVEVTEADDADGDGNENEVEPASKMEKSITEFIVKAANQTSKENAALGTLLKANLDQNAVLKAKVEDTDSKLEKAMSTIAELQNKLGATSQGRKSIIKAGAAVPLEKESFEKSRQVSTQADTVILSKSRDYSKVLDLVDGYCDQQGMRADLSKAVMDFESTKQLPAHIAVEIKRELGVTIVD